MTEVINLFAGPGAGKSTTAAGVFYEMKLAGLNVELVTEFAKDLTWDKNFRDLNNQILVFGTQLQRMQRVDDQVDYIITDSPLLLSSIYLTETLGVFDQTINPVFSSFNNINFFIDRVKVYNPVGRSQTENEAKAIDRKVLNLLNTHQHPFSRIRGDECAAAVITNLVLN